MKIDLEIHDGLGKNFERYSAINGKSVNKCLIELIEEYVEDCMDYEFAVDSKKESEETGDEGVPISEIMKKLDLGVKDS